MGHLHVSFVLLFLFCSPWQSDGKTFMTHLGTQCVEDCKPDHGEFSCKTTDKDGATQTMYCSPGENVDYLNRQCRSDSECGKHGENYYWCRVSVFSWGYCGLVEDEQKISDAGKDTQITSRIRNKRQPQEQIITTLYDKHNRKKTVFRAAAAPNDFTDLNNKAKSEARKLMGQWKSQYLPQQARSELIKSKNFRIDMQGFVPRNNIQYYNLQVQTNGQNSRTVSQILVPDGVPDRYMRRAFLESLNLKARVFIDVERI